MIFIKSNAQTAVASDHEPVTARIAIDRACRWRLDTDNLGAVPPVIFKRQPPIREFLMVTNIAIAHAQGSRRKLHAKFVVVLDSPLAGVQEGRYPSGGNSSSSSKANASPEMMFAAPCKHSINDGCGMIEFNR